MKFTTYSAALAILATMAFAASASATSVTTSTGGAAATPAIHAVNENGHIFFENAWITVPCSSTLEGDIESHGAGLPASGAIDHLTFTGCTNSWHVTTINPGSFSITHTSGHNGTLVSNGARIEMTRFGIKCVYETNNTHLGTLTGGNPATLHIDAFLLLDEDVSSGLCDLAAAWFADYVTTSALYPAP
jgi:hypothetical protein